MTEGLTRWRETFWVKLYSWAECTSAAESRTVSFRGSVSLATPLTPVFASHLSNHTKSLGTNITNLSDRRVLPARVHLPDNLHLTRRNPRLGKARLKVHHFCISSRICLLMLCNLLKLGRCFSWRFIPLNRFMQR